MADEKPDVVQVPPVSVEVNGGAPAKTTKELLGELEREMRVVHDFVIAQGALKLPERVGKLETVLRYAMGFAGGLLAIESLRTILTYVTPAAVRAVEEIIR